MKSFIGDFFTEQESKVLFLGFKSGPASVRELSNIRKVSEFIEPFDVDKKKNFLSDLKFADLGNFTNENIGEKISSSLSVQKIPFVLSHGHLSSYYSLQNFPRETKVIILDAHADLKNHYIDEKIIKANEFTKANPNEELNDSTWLRRLFEKNLQKNILLLGVRSIDEDELSFMRKNRILFFTSSQIKKEIWKVITFLRNFTLNSKLYISLDIDVFDPSIVPTVHYPEAGGIFYENFVKIMENISRSAKIVGADVVGFKKSTRQVTDFLTIKAVFDILGKINGKY